MTENEILIEIRALARQLKDIVDEYERIDGELEVVASVEHHFTYLRGERRKRNLVMLHQEIIEKIAAAALKLLDARGMVSK